MREDNGSTAAHDEKTTSDKRFERRCERLLSHLSYTAKPW
jgi:hypothetical protein